MRLIRLLAAGAIAVTTTVYLRRALAPQGASAPSVDDSTTGMPLETLPVAPAEVEESMHREAMARARSEIASGEFDMQG